jgi:predicted protein tyrosine phosphatase
MNNRLWNCKNPYQGKDLKVLTLCSAGLLRSPTLAWILSNEPFNFNTRAAGVSKSFALIPVDEVLLEWADIVVCVESDVFDQLSADFELDDTKTFVCLNASDSFEFKDPELIAIMTEQVTERFKALGII